MLKLTVLYGHPAAPKLSRSTTRATHMPLVSKVSGFSRTEKSKLVGTPDDERRAFYRMFDNEDALQATMGSPEGKAAVADLGRFATWRHSTRING